MLSVTNLSNPDQVAVLPAPSQAAETIPTKALPHPALPEMELERAIAKWRAAEKNQPTNDSLIEYVRECLLEEVAEQLHKIRSLPNQVAAPLILKLDGYHNVPSWNWKAAHDISIVELSTNQEYSYIDKNSRCPQNTKDNIAQFLTELPNLAKVRFHGIDLLCNIEGCATVKAVEIFEANYVGWQDSQEEIDTLAQILSIKNLTQISLHGSLSFFQAIPPLAAQIKKLEVELTDEESSSLNIITSQITKIIKPLLFLESLTTNVPFSTAEVAQCMPTLHTFILTPMPTIPHYSFSKSLQACCLPFLQNLAHLQSIEIDLAGQYALKADKLLPLLESIPIKSLRLNDIQLFKIPPALLRIKTLTSLELIKNWISGSYDFSPLSALKKLSLHGNQKLRVIGMPSQLEEVTIKRCTILENVVNDFLSTATCLKKIEIASINKSPLKTLPEKVWALTPSVEVFLHPAEMDTAIATQKKLFEKKHSDCPYIYLSNPKHVKNILSRLHHLIQPEVYGQWMTRASFQTTKRYLAACNPQDIETLEEWISKASTTEDVLNGSTGKGFSNWIITLFEALAIDQETHYLVLNHMEAGLETCSDRGVLSILDLSIYLRAVIASKNSSLKELATICLKSIIPYRIINDSAQEVAQTLFLTDESIDIVAVCVQIMLSANQQFGFELPLESCRYHIDIELDEIDSILKGCRHILKRAKPEELLIENGFWLEALEKRRNKEFSAIQEKKMAALALLADEDQTNAVLLKQITIKANLALLNLTKQAMEDDCPACSS